MGALLRQDSVLQILISLQGLTQVSLCQDTRDGGCHLTLPFRSFWSLLWKEPEKSLFQYNQ